MSINGHNTLAKNGLEYKRTTANFLKIGSNTLTTAIENAFDANKNPVQYFYPKYPPTHNTYQNTIPQMISK